MKFGRSRVSRPPKYYDAISGARRGVVVGREGNGLVRMGEKGCHSQGVLGWERDNHKHWQEGGNSNNDNDVGNDDPKSKDTTSQFYGT